MPQVGLLNNTGFFYLVALIVIIFFHLHPFYSFRPKSYVCRLDDGEEKKKLKGIGRAVTKNKISFKDYEKTLRTHLPQRHQMTCIRSINHQLQMLNVEKTSLSLFDDKRYWKNHYDSVPYGHPICQS